MPHLIRSHLLQTCALAIAVAGCHSTTAAVFHRAGNELAQTQGTIVGGSPERLHLVTTDAKNVEIKRSKISSIRHPGERGALVGGMFTIAGATLLAAGVVFLAVQPLDDEYNNVMVAIPLVTLSTLGIGIGLPTFFINQGRESDSIERMSPGQTNYTLRIQGNF